MSYVYFICFWSHETDRPYNAEIKCGGKITCIKDIKEAEKAMYEQDAGHVTIINYQLLRTEN